MVDLTMALLVLVIVVATTVLLVTEWLPMELIALLPPCHWQKPIRLLRVPANNSREGGRERVRRESDVSKLLRRRDGRTVLPTWAQVPDS